MAAISSLLIGMLFGMGLLWAGMANPAKVLGFLDLFGQWDPSLAFVMGGGLVTSAAGYWLFAKKRQRALLSDRMRLPTATAVTRRLIVGSAIFGVGWGLAGICPGPALTLAGSGFWQGLVFVLSMMLGMMVQHIVVSRCPLSDSCAAPLGEGKQGKSS